MENKKINAVIIFPKLLESKFDCKIGGKNKEQSLELNPTLPCTEENDPSAMLTSFLSLPHGTYKNNKFEKLIM